MPVHNIKIEVSFYIALAVAIILLPVRLVFSWVIAVAVHEFAHYLALKLTGVDVYKIRVSLSGVRMGVDELSGWRAVVCSLAGPIGGLLPLIIRRWMPCTAICATLHSCYNLIPIFTLDGGRALEAVLVKVLGNRVGDRVHFIFSCTLVCAIIVATFYVCLRYNFPLWILLTLFMIISFNILKISLQRWLTNSTIVKTF